LTGDPGIPHHVLAEHRMKVGVIFPQLEIGSDPAAVRDYAVAVEEAGYDYILAFDHVLGAHPDRFAGANVSFARPPYTHESPFHEPFVLFGYLAAVTRRVGLATGVLVLPQRQTALVAKQAAAIDVLSGGRLRLAVGTGWNFTEYEALGEDFHTRGARVAEQIEVLRRLWTEPLVTFDGRWHHLDRVGINPLPVQRPIPVWMGGMADRVLRRLARTADGWFPAMRPDERGRAAIARLHGYVREAGRDPASIGIEGGFSIATGSPEDWHAQAAAWRVLGATHISVNTMGGGLDSPTGHIERVVAAKRALDGR
jgi:probable F420-dependent oxidoreductase